MNNYQSLPDGFEQIDFYSETFNEYIETYGIKWGSLDGCTFVYYSESYNGNWCDLIETFEQQGIPHVIIKDEYGSSMLAF